MNFQIDLPDTVYTEEYPFSAGMQAPTLYCPILVAFAEHVLSLNVYRLGVAVVS